jgi:hypothetical protein
MPDHQADRPTWICSTCAQLWPCRGGRERLRQQFGRDRVGLSIHMVSLLHIASADLYLRDGGLHTDPSELHARFIAWTH